MEKSLKATGMVRPVDELGRIVIPKEIRDLLDINKDNPKKKDPLEIFLMGDSIVLKKYMPFCIFCGSSEDLVSLDGKNVCRECVKKLSSNI